MSDELLTVPQVAKWLQVSTGWVQQHASGIRKPLLPSVKLGRSRRFRKAAIEVFIRECEEMEAQKTS